MFRIINVSDRDDFSEDIYFLEKECFPSEAWSLETIKSSIQNTNTIYLICLSEQKSVGYICAHYVIDEAELDRIAVLRTHEGQGIGKTLLSNLVNVLKSRDVSRLMLEVRTQNSRALSLYNSYGFSLDAVRSNYYHNPSDDAFLMSLKL